jgi:hypothetical protein
MRVLRTQPAYAVLDAAMLQLGVVSPAMLVALVP